MKYMNIYYKLLKKDTLLILVAYLFYDNTNSAKALKK